MIHTWYALTLVSLAAVIGGLVGFIVGQLTLFDEPPEDGQA